MHSYLIRAMVVLGLALGASTPVYAQDIDKSRAAQIAQQRYGGQLFGKIKQSVAADGTTIYEVRLDNGGRMTIVYVDGKGNIRDKK